MLVIKDISKTFNPGKPTQSVAVNNLSLEFPRGSFTAVVGANGSGKSTLLNLIAGSLQVDKGEIILNGRPIEKLPDYKRTKHIARVFQNPLAGTAASLSIIDNFRMAALRRKPKLLKIGTDKAFQALVEEKVSGLGMGLASKLSLPIGTLSGGQRQALTLLMTIMSEVEVLLLDEPTAALDPRSARQVMEIANNLILDHQLTALLVTHNIQEALRYGDRIIQIDNGQVVKDIAGAEKHALEQAEVLNWFDYF